MRQDEHIKMYWPFKTTVKFVTDDARELRVEYLVSANSSVGGQMRTFRRVASWTTRCWLHNRKVVAETKRQAPMFKLPSGCVQLLG